MTNYRELSNLILGVLCLAGVTVGQGKIDFVKDIQPIFKARCAECHGGEEEEGDLSLEVKDSVFDNTREVPVVTPGKPKKSTLYLRLILDADDADIMPADGDPLTKGQIAKIKRWIEEGAKWPDSASAKATAKRPPEAVTVPELDAAAKAAEAKALAALKKRGATAMHIARNSNGVYVNMSLLGSKVTDADLALLRGLEKSLVWLNLGRTKVSNAGAEALASFPHLRRLHLEQTAVDDTAMQHIVQLGNLEYLNLYGTKVSDAGLAALAKLAGLRKLFVWQTKASEQGVARLAKALPKLEVDRGGYVKELQAVAARVKAMQPVNDMCPIMPKRKVNRLKTVRHKNETIAFCCDRCVAKFKKDPSKYLANVKRKGAKKKAAKKKGGKKVAKKNAAKATPVNAMCPIMPKRRAKPGKVVVYKGEAIGFCCGRCVARFKKDPEKYIGKVQRKAGAAPKKPKKTAANRALNATCPFSDRPVAAGATTAYRGHVIGFCCTRCRDKFAAAPDKFPKVLALLPKKK